MINKLFENEKYAPLREMESYTQEMFNYIIDFQEKKHPAWNESLSFDEGIKTLPLHYLIFSNADRDPKQFGPTISPFYPLREEVVKISHYIKQLSDNATLCDYFSNNGFVGSLIAREGVNTTCIQQGNKLPNQIGKFHDDSVYQFADNSVDQKSFDAVIATWPESEENPTPAIMAMQPKLIIYIYTEHKNEETNKRQCGTEDMFDLLTTDYELFDNWTVTRQKDLLHEIWPDMTPNIEEHRLVRIYAKKDILPLKPATIPDNLTPYDWERDLYMAELALEAKRELDMRRMMM